MKQSDFYNELLDRFNTLVENHHLAKEVITVSGKVLNPEEAIGNPTRRDFPILKGKEKLMEADFKGQKGQAYTDMPDNFSGTIEEILSQPLETNYDRAVLISTINAVCKYLNITEKTIHCKDDEPEQCSKELAGYIKDNYGSPKIALIGLQPSMLQMLSDKYQIRAVDLDKDNIGTTKFGVKIEDGEKHTDDVLKWCDLILSTGSTIVNGSIVNFITHKPTIFYGTSIAGSAALMNLNHFCECSR